MSNSKVLNLTTTDPIDGSDIAVPYAILSDGTPRAIDRIQYGQAPFVSSAGVQSSAEDLLEFSIALFAGSDESSFGLPESRNIWSPVCEFPACLASRASAAMGWFRMDGQCITESLLDICIKGTTMNPEDTANLIPRGRRIIYFHAGYVGGYHSALYALPETKCAIAVLSNSSGCGDCVEWIAQLLLAIVCGDEIDPTTLLLLSEKQKDRDRLQWSQIESALLETSSGAAGEDLFGMTYSEDSTVAGHYYNEKFGITVEIWQQGRSKTTCFISFQPQEPRQAMVLKHWRGSIWSFFPTEEEYHLRVMKHLSRWSKFLLHLEVSANHSKPSGFWWQYDHSIDGIWFSRLEK